METKSTLMRPVLYIVVSLPRTGTTSLCTMGDICNCKSCHVLGDEKILDLLKQGYNFFADTPFYSPEFLLGIIEVLQSEYDIKFIYSHRDTESWKNSFNKLTSKWSYPKHPTCTSKWDFYDYICYRSMITDPETHYSVIKNIASMYDISVLDYSFKEGWAPFCEFLSVDIPDKDLPWLNTLN
jgi:hypothetical protein